MGSNKFINQETKMYYLVNVVHKNMVTYLTRHDCEGFKQSCIFNAMDKTNDDTLWNDSENDGNVRSVCV
jgi:hypothetical protein